MMRADKSQPSKEPLSPDSRENSVPAPNFRALFESTPDPCLVLDRNLRIVAVNHAYLQSTMTKREEITGRGIFDVFPDNPADPHPTGVRNLRASLNRVLKDRVTDVMAVQKYDIRRPAAEGGDFEERYWSPTNTPVFGTDNEVAFILHRVQDVTEFVQFHTNEIKVEDVTEALRTRAALMEAENFAKSQEIAQINLRLKQANEELEMQYEKLRESEQRFASFMLHLPAAAWIKDLRGRYVYLNSEAQHIFPAPLPELLGKTDEELFPTQTARQFQEGDRRVLAGETSVQTTESMAHDNGIEHCSIVSKFAVPGPEGEPAYVAGIALDITERKRAESALRLSEARYRALYRDNPTMVVTIDTDLTMLSVNPTCASQLGYGAEELEGESVLKLFLEEDRPAVTEQLRLCLRNPDQVYHWQFRKIRRDGGLLWIEETAQAVYDLNHHLNVLVVCQDITERKHAEEALQESEERFRLVAATAPVMIWEAGPDGRCTFVNKPWLDYTGRDQEQELGDGWMQDVHPDDIEPCTATYLAAFLARRSFSQEYRLRRADGAYGWIVDTGIPRLAPDGELLGYIGTCFDITDRKRAREELQNANLLLAQRVAERTAELSETVERLQDEITERINIGQALQLETTERINVQAELREKELLLLQQSRLAAMGEMIGNIANQWRQPLNLLGLLAQDLSMTYKKGEFSPEYFDTTVKKVLETIRHMSRTIDDFRNFFKPYKEKVEFRVLEVVEKTISLLEGSLNAQEIRTAVVAKSDPVVNGYPNEFSQVLLNIMVNARDALMTRQATDPTITIEVGAEGGRCVVTITDNAGGIPEEIIDKIFDPYFTTKGPDKGTGVGLFMSKTIVEKNMDGSLSARNVGDGAQFRIVI
jgi:PAS domain S-box-containing protein